jgi:hypothetical protein
VIAILDPALFRIENISIQELSALRRILEDVERVLRRCEARVPNVGWYWAELQKQLVRPLLRAVQALRPEKSEEQQVLRGLQASVDSLRSRAGYVSFTDPSGPVRTWGVKPLFEWLSPEWHQIMRRVLLGCVTSEEDLLLVVRLCEGRNLETIRHGHARIYLKTRWRVSIQHAGKTSRIPCVRNLRNLDVPWTCRLDEHLPSTFEHASHPFCPPVRWDKRDTVVQGTHTSVPAWIDGLGNGWAPPSTGGGYHWDVFLVHALEEQIGLSPINVTRWGGPPVQGVSGDLHHVPRVKRSRLRTEAGWSCPPEP